MPANKYIGFIHWPRLWAGLSPMCLSGKYDPTAFDPITLRDEVWSGTLGSNKIPIKVHRDGSFLFDLQLYCGGNLIPEDLSSQSMTSIGNLDEQRCEFLSAYLYCLHTKISSEQKQTVSKMIVRPKMLVIESDQIINVKEDQLASQLAQAPYAGSYSDEKPQFMDFRVNTHPGNCVHTNTLSAAGSLFSKILDSDKSEELIRLCSLQLRAYEDAEQHQYRFSLAQAFMVSEFILSEMYSERNDNEANRDSIFKKIKSLCHEGIELPVCQACRSDFKKSRKESLSWKECLSGTLTEEDVEEGRICLNRVRLCRNKWIHGHDVIQANEAEEAIRVSEDLIRMRYGLTLFSNLHQSARTW